MLEHAHPLFNLLKSIESWKWARVGHGRPRIPLGEGSGPLTAAPVAASGSLS